MKTKFLLICMALLMLGLSVCGCARIPSASDDISGDTAYVNSSHVAVSQVMNMSFEDCLATATHVLSAVYTGEYETHGIYYDLVFSPERQLKGTAITDDFHIRVSDQDAAVAGTGLTDSESPVNYETGTSYLLVLEKQVSVYYPYDLYLPLGNIHITEEEAFSYVSNYLADCPDPPDALGTDYIRSSVLSDIVDGTSVIATVTPTEYIGGSDNNDTTRYLCRVEHSIKGVAGDTMNIIFFKDTVKIGAQYVVMVEPLSEASSYYILSSKSSVYPASDKNILQQIETTVSAK